MRKQNRLLPNNPTDTCSQPDTTGAPPPTTPARSPGGKFLPGQSGNPKGRPRGAYNQAAATVKALLEENADALTRAAINDAIAGNALAMKLCLERLAPPSQTRTVTFDLNAKLPRGPVDPDRLLTQHQSVLQAVAAGQLSPIEGQAVSQILEGARRTWDSANIAERLTLLEERAASIQSNPKAPTVRWIDDDEQEEAEQDEADQDQADQDEAERNAEQDDDNSDTGNTHD